MNNTLSDKTFIYMVLNIQTKDSFVFPDPAAAAKFLKQLLPEDRLDWKVFQMVFGNPKTDTVENL
jgi:hypothetical protein